MVSIKLSLKKPVPPIVRKEIRDYYKVTPKNFTKTYTTPNYSPNTTLDEACYLFKEELLKALNQMAPLKTIKCSDRQKHPWHNKFSKEQKRVVKNRKKHGENTNKIISSRHTQRKGIYTIGYSFIIKKQTLLQKIQGSNKDTKQLFNLTNSLTNSKSGNPMPEGLTDVKLAEEFATFFLEKN